MRRGPIRDMLPEKPFVDTEEWPQRILIMQLEPPEMRDRCDRRAPPIDGPVESSRFAEEGELGCRQICRRGRLATDAPCAA